MLSGRWSKVMVAVVVFLLGVSSFGTVTAEGVVNRPNIVFVLTDDLSTNLVTKQFMPYLWALERHGTTFANYFVADSLCCPSRASIFTGRFPHDTGVYTNGGKYGGYGAFNAHHDEDSTLATDLHAAGYRTAMMGKYLNQYETTDPSAPGWDDWDVANLGYPEFNYSLNENGHVVRYGGPDQETPGHKPKDNYLTDVVSRLADRYVSSTTARYPGDPFFLEVATFAPHSPYTPAPRYAHLYPRLAYPRTPAFDAKSTAPPEWLSGRPPLSSKQLREITTDFQKRAESVKSVDNLIRSLVATLRRTGVLDNTYFVFSSDNGYHMGEHRLLPGKLTAFDTDIHVPLIIVGPRIRPGSTITAFAENIDLRPTFDALAGIHPSEPVDGWNLAPLVLGSSNPSGVALDWRQGVLVEHRGPVGKDAGPDRPEPFSGNPPSYEALRLAGSLYVEYADGEREYYDLKTDPYELDNIYSSLAPARAAALHREIRLLKNCHDRPACSRVYDPGSAGRQVPGRALSRGGRAPASLGGARGV